MSEKIINSHRYDTVYLETYGCQMNEYDSELLTSILSDAGYSFVKSEYDAGIIMLNTCSIREHANDKVFNRLFKLAKEHKKNKVLIGILGCMAENLQHKLFQDTRLKIDFITGPDSYKKLPQILQTLQIEGSKGFDVELSDIETYSDIIPLRKKGVNAWIAIMRGCNNFCSYCVVPYTRGRERSRGLQSIVNEVNKAVSEGFKQVTLLGQNVNSYLYENYDFSDLLNIISEVSGLQRIRFMTSHPKDVPEKLIKTMGENNKICKHIHLPLQAGNNRILKLMNRGYTQKQYLELVDLIRKYIPHVILTTDFIVGFPTETDDEYQDTVYVMKTVQFDSAFFFKYSPREGTHANKNYMDDINDESKTLRITQLVEMQKEISYNKNKNFIGSIQRVLIEEIGTKKNKNDYQGRNDGNKLVIFPFPGQHCNIGDFIDLKITDATPNILKGKMIE